MTLLNLVTPWTVIVHAPQSIKSLQKGVKPNEVPVSQINMSDLGSNGTSILGPLFSFPYVPPKVPRIAWTQAKHSLTFIESSTEWNLESNHHSLRKSLLPSQNLSNVDVQRSTIGQRGPWTPQPNLRRWAYLKKIWAHNFPLFYLKCFLVRELMKSDPSNLGGKLWGWRWHQETRLNGSEQHFHRQVGLWLTRERWWRQCVEYRQNIQPLNQLRALDQQMEIDMQQEKVTDNKLTKVL